ncbi:MAG: uroporphyrinogen decarboxylase family protein [Nitrososphaerales archaeon]
MIQNRSLLKERLHKSIQCGTPDRIPIAVRLEYAAATWTGMNFADFALDPRRASEAMELVYDKLGGWDAVDASWTLGTRWSKLEAAKVQLPGVDFSEQLPHRIEDYPVMNPEDYSVAVKEGMYGLLAILMSRLGRKFDEDIEKEVFTSFTPIYRHWEEDRGIPVYRGGMVRPPFVQFSMWRTWRGIAQDLLRRREMLKEAGEAVWEDMVKMGENQSRIVGCNFVFIPCGRVSATFLSERLFLEYFFPYLKMTVEELVRDGFTPRLHCDTDWAPFLEYFLELPKKSCILELGHTTSIKRAKEILGGHMCLYGDVPSNLLSSGSPAKVEAYCKKLIDDVGRDGFILANDDIVPHNAKFENVKMLIDAGKKYG